MYPARHKLLLLTTDLLRGGTPTVVRELAFRLHQRGHQVEVACLASPGPVSEEIKRAGVAAHALHARGQTDLAVFARLHSLICRGRYSRILSFLIHANFAAALNAPVFRSTRFFQSIQTTQPSPAWHWTLQSAIHPAARRILVPSHAVAELAVSRCGVPSDKIAVIPNAVEPADFTSHSPSTSGRFRVVFIGRLDPVKRIPDLVSAMSRLPPDCFTLDLYGEGAERPLLETLVARLPRHAIHLRGVAESPVAPLAHADLLVLPSEAEGFGLVLLEAMAAGVPVVASAAPGITDLLRHDYNALLFPVGDAAALAEGIRRIASDAALSDRLVTTARSSTLPRFTWQRVLPQYESALELI